MATHQTRVYRQSARRRTPRREEQAIWQRRFWEHRIRNEADFANHVQYIDDNPVKHGYVQRPEDWPYSSIHRHNAPPTP